MRSKQKGHDDSMEDDYHLQKSKEGENIQKAISGMDPYDVHALFNEMDRDLRDIEYEAQLTKWNFKRLGDVRAHILKLRSQDKTDPSKTPRKTAKKKVKTQH